MSDIFLVKEPRTSEKATELQGQGKYVFMVKPTATKSEIKKAMKDLYRVDVTSVRVLNAKGKAKRFRGLRGHKPSMRKAVVTLRSGQKIDLGR